MRTRYARQTSPFIAACFLLVFLIGCGSGESTAPAINIKLPEGWFDESDMSIVENLQKMDMTAEEMQQIMSTHSGDVAAAVYLKHDKRAYPGVIPTIQVNLRRYSWSSLSDFQAALEKDVRKMGRLYNGFKITKPFEQTTVGGHEALWFMSTFDLPVAGQEVLVRSWAYAVPVGDYFYQINFSDMGEEDCSELYDKVISEVTFGAKAAAR